MAQHYSNPKRASEPTALPDVETFYVDPTEIDTPDDPMDGMEAGWYWHICFPGCLPDGMPNGPFATEADAVADAQSESVDDDTDDDEPDDDIDTVPDPELG